MIEKHPFENFIPDSCELLILGSFLGKESTQAKREDDWFYGANRNQFWKIIELIYNSNFNNKIEKQNLFNNLKIGITDIISSCERKENNNSDNNLTNKTYNNKIVDILSTYPIKKVLFTSKNVYKEFSENFKKPKGVELVVLPSPSPIYRRLNLNDKASEYKKYFPLR